MQDSLESAYMHMALSNDTYCAPVGISWSNSTGGGDPMDLFSSDGSHPSLAGSYLAACTFYATIFNKSPEGIVYTAGLDQEAARYLQEIAAYTVLTNPAQWNIFHPEPVIASFTYELEGFIADFLNSSSNTTDFLWDFGDPLSGSQNTSTLENPSHEYSLPGNYIVTLIAGDSCLSDEVRDTLVILETGIVDSGLSGNIKVYPNPVTDYIIIESSKDQNLHSFRLISSDNTTHLKGEIEIINGKSQISGLASLPSGVYILILVADEFQHSRKIIINR